MDTIANLFIGVLHFDYVYYKVCIDETPSYIGI